MYLALDIYLWYIAEKHIVNTDKKDKLSENILFAKLSIHKSYDNWMWECEIEMINKPKNKLLWAKNNTF